MLYGFIVEPLLSDVCVVNLWQGASIVFLIVTATNQNSARKRNDFLNFTTIIVAFAWFRFTPKKRVSFYVKRFLVFILNGHQHQEWTPLNFIKSILYDLTPERRLKFQLLDLTQINKLGNLIKLFNIPKNYNWTSFSN